MKFICNLDLVLKNLAFEIEADSEEEVKEKLLNLSTEEIIDAADEFGSYDKYGYGESYRHDITNVEIEQASAKVHVHDIVYEEATQAPTELEVECNLNYQDIDESDVEEAIWVKTGVWPESFEFEIL